jgi:uncharacterized YccA/Bax inhibitor family protein
MSNPMLSEKVLQREAQAGGASATAAGWAAPQPATVYHPPIDDGPTTTYRTAVDSMSVGGTVTAAGVLFVLLLIAAAFGWNAVEPQTETSPANIPWWVWIGPIVGLGFVILASFKPHLARFTAPVYAVAQGVFVGAISRLYETQWNGIVVQAAGATIAVTGVMLFLHTSRILKVTDRFRRIVIGATLGLAVFYGISLLISLFGGTPPFLQSASVFGIGFSIFAAGLAALNLSLDFDMIEKGVAMRAPKFMEWFCAQALMVTIVWLYLELLRLLGKLRSN